MLALALGESLTSSIDGTEACGVFVKCDEESGRATKSILDTFAICLVALFFRAAFFAFERAAFKKIMRFASNIEASATIMAKSVGALGKAELQDHVMSPPMEKKGSDRLEQIRQKATGLEGNTRGRSSTLHVKKTELSHEALTFVHDVTCLMESANWKHWFFTTETKVAVEEYGPIRGDNSAAGTVHRKIKGCTICRTTMTLKTNLQELVDYHLDFLEPARFEGGVERAIVAGEGTDVRTLWSTLPMLGGFSTRDVLFLEVVREYDFDGRRAVLICGGPCTHPSKPKEKSVVRLDRMLFADFYEEVDGDTTKWTNLFSTDTKVPWIFRGFARRLFAGVQNDRINMYALKYERDSRCDLLAHELEEKNAVKLNIVNTLRKIFTGSRMYLFVVAVHVLFIVYSQTIRRSTNAHFVDYWNSTGLCNPISVIRN